MNLKESKNGYMIGFEGRKGKGKCWNYIIIITKKVKMKRAEELALEE